MAYTYKIGISAEEHDLFVKQSDQTNLLQSSQWAKVKSGWDNERLGFFRDGKLVAVASVLIRNLGLPVGFTMIYIPRGPVMDYNDQDLVSFVLKSLIKFGKQRRSIVIKFDPFIQLTRYLSNGQVIENPSTIEIKDRLISQGCNWSGRVHTLWETVQPTFHAVLKEESFSEGSLNKKVRQNIRTARNKGIDVYVGREDLLEDFSEILKKTEERKSINLRGKSYYEKILTSYPKDAHIILAYLNLNKRFENLMEKKEKLESEEITFTRETKPSKIANHDKEIQHVIEELEFLKSFMESGKTKVPLAGTLTIDFGGTSENIYAGMDETFRQYQPALLTWVETAKQAFERGASWQNLGGVEPNFDGGLYHFKSRLNPTIEEYIGEFDLIVSPILYRIFQTLLYSRKKIITKK